jgi:hypothetical protein
VLTASQALLLITHLQKENGFDVNVIFYKGGAPTVQDLLAGVTDMALTTLAALEPHVRAGRLRALATTGEARTPVLPDTPTLHEQGVKGYPTYSWWGLYAPAGTPRPIVERMNAEAAKAVRSPRWRRNSPPDRHGNLATSPEAFADFQKVEQARWQGHRETASRPTERILKPAGGSHGVVPICPGDDTSRISILSEVRISLWRRYPGMKSESPFSTRIVRPSSNSRSTQPSSM